MARMTPQVSEVLEKALALSTQDRGLVIDRLIASLDEGPAEEGVEEAWAAEIAANRRCSVGESQNDTGRGSASPPRRSAVKWREVSLIASIRKRCNLARPFHEQSSNRGRDQSGAGS